MIVSYLPAGSGDQLPPTPDKSYFTYSTYTETINDTEYTFAELLSCHFSSFTDESVTMPNEIDGYSIKRYNAKMFSISELGSVTKIYFTNTDYEFSLTESGVVTLFPEPIEEVYMTYFNQSYRITGQYSKIRVGRSNGVLKKFEVQNKNDISTVNEFDFANCLNLTYNPFPLATVCNEGAFFNSGINGKNLDNFFVLNSQAFYECKSLKNVSFNGVTTINDYFVFAECPSLETIELRNASRIDGTALFKYDTNLKDVYWDNLQSLHFGSSREEDSPFYGCEKLEHIYTKAENVEYLQSVFAHCSYYVYGARLADLVTALPAE